MKEIRFYRSQLWPWRFIEPVRFDLACLSKVGMAPPAPGPPPAVPTSDSADLPGFIIILRTEGCNSATTTTRRPWSCSKLRLTRLIVCMVSQVCMLKEQDLSPAPATPAGSAAACRSVLESFSLQSFPPSKLRGCTEGSSEGAPRRCPRIDEFRFLVFITRRLR